MSRIERARATATVRLTIKTAPSRTTPDTVALALSLGWASAGRAPDWPFRVLPECHALTPVAVAAQELKIARRV